MKSKLFKDLLKSMAKTRQMKANKRKYKSFRVQSIECSKNGTRIEVPCIVCDQVNLICKKYNCYCYSKACLKERMK